ncbi:hydroxysteroid 11-beta-dehydrogenase 1-like protein [Lingula anatina]|uniref:Hydroxysteroid 11-beta-dehydrogenase 1-like protein n=1 Tax=Lingula anatina TaxID=7574 RepID=A0A1S3JNU0_LINAN|nr:hydroxysteroid 11-beta-dehydrogenase 1-like protein [Lingula anatina]|eukprot:XP_013411644.1 hydroxysteroid 11-beta-dehydrogenase 1-like protein [Lingula anatina]
MSRAGAVLVVLLASYVAYCLIDTFDPETVRGKTVLVTGSSSGIGEQLAYHYARLGANVVVTGRRENLLKKVVARCNELSGKQVHKYVVADMNRMDEVEKFTESTFNGKLDVLMLNHGYNELLELWTGHQDNLTMHERVMNTNFMSHVFLASRLMPLLEKSSGRIGVTSSILGVIPMPFVASYSSSKHALSSFFSALRMDLVLQGSSVSITNGIVGSTATERHVSELKKYIGRPDIPFATGTPEDVAMALLKATMLRQSEVFAPWLPALSFIRILRVIAPDLADYVIRYGEQSLRQGN